jgi:hypothetical protein
MELLLQFSVILVTLLGFNTAETAATAQGSQPLLSEANSFIPDVTDNNHFMSQSDQRAAAKKV